MGRHRKENYRVISSFPYKGKDGNEKTIAVIGPGEPLPKLDSEQIEKLLHEGRICEVDQYGENVSNKRLQSLNGEAVNRLFETKDVKTVLEIINTTAFDKETLALMSLATEKFKSPLIISQAIDSKM